MKAEGKDKLSGVVLGTDNSTQALIVMSCYRQRVHKKPLERQ